MRILITGGAYSGKTTIIDEFSRLGYPIVPESAIEVIKELKEKWSFIRQEKWRNDNFVQFETLIVEKQLELESEVSGDLIFLDNGVHGSVAYCNIRGLKLSNEVLQKIEAVNYDFVFILDTLAEFDERRDTGRLDTKELSCRTRDELKKVYEGYGMKAISVPEMSVKERVDFILKKING